MRAPSSSDLPRAAADLLERLRRQGPRVHCLTNAVAQSFTANVLLALGAVPSMTVAAEEIAAFAARADAVLINLGTLDPQRRAAAAIAVATAIDEARPWVLDPVLVDRSPARADFARSLAARGPAAVRLNLAELEALSRAPGGEEEEVARYARGLRAVLALTGPTDLVTDGERSARIENGDPLMSRVTATGCASSAVVAAFLAVEADPWLAALSGLTIYAVAGETAAARARGPGSFAVELIDALASADRQMLQARAKVR
jgi:hydroxyethylthiazole kinase